jgi:hypothetical protein
MSKIPESAFKVLSKKWKPYDGYSVFDANYSGDKNRYRRAKPSKYKLRFDNHDVCPLAQISFSEASGLVKDNVFEGLAIESEDRKLISLNEHALHAFQDFCQETYLSWEKFRGRLNLVAKQGSLPEDTMDESI